MRDMNSYAKAVAVVDPAVIDDAAPVVSAAIDLQGFEAAVFLAHIGASADTLSGTVYFDFLLEHAPDDGSGAAGTYAAVAATDVVGVTPADGVVLTVDAPGEEEQVYQWGYIGGKRFLRLTITPEGTHANGTPMSVAMLKMLPNFVPVA